MSAASCIGGISYREEEEIQISEHHRNCVTKYYGHLLRRYGWKPFINQIHRLKRVVWHARGLDMVERKIKRRGL